ncbi:MAG: endonuclease/exonuclease/phosphatase family protein, partial [Bacteroidales bacterium]
MKKLDLIIFKIFLFSFFLPGCSEATSIINGPLDPEIENPVIQQNITFKLIDQESKKVIPDAMCILGADINNRWIYIEDMNSDKNGISATPASLIRWKIKRNLSPAVEVNDKSTGVLTVIHPEYKPVQIKIDNLLEGTAKEFIIQLKSREAGECAVLCYNTWESFKEVADIEIVYEWIRKLNPDIIFFQELNGNSEESLNKFARNYGHNYSALLKDWGYPTGITSRFPLENTERRTGGNSGMYHGYIYTQCNGFHLLAPHLNPFSNGTKPTRLQEAQRLVQDMKELPENARIILAGDLNAKNKFDMDAFSDYASLNESNETAFDFDPIQTLETMLTDTYPIHNRLFKASYNVRKDITINPKSSFRIDYIMVDKASRNKCIFSDILQTKFTNKISDHYPNFIYLIK